LTEFARENGYGMAGKTKKRITKAQARVVRLYSDGVFIVSPRKWTNRNKKYFSVISVCSVVKKTIDEFITP